MRSRARVGINANTSRGVSARLQPGTRADATEQMGAGRGSGPCSESGRPGAGAAAPVGRRRRRTRSSGISAPGPRRLPRSRRPARRRGAREPTARTCFALSPEIGGGKEGDELGEKVRRKEEGRRRRRPLGLVRFGGWSGERRRHGHPWRGGLATWMRPFYHVWLWNARALANRGVLRRGLLSICKNLSKFRSLNYYLKHHVHKICFYIFSLFNSFTSIFVINLYSEQGGTI